MGTHRILLLSLFGALLLGCGGIPVRCDYDTRAPFGRYHRFDWTASPRRVRAREVEHPLLERRITEALARELEARGLRLETAEEPDLLVTCYPVFETRRVRTGSAVHLGTGWGNRPRAGVGVTLRSTRVHRWKEGSIVVEMSDFRSRQVVWQGVAEGVLRGGESPEEAEARVQEAVRRLLEAFPPKPRS